MQSTFDLIALLLVLAAIFGYLNNRFLGLPLTVGLLLLALVSAVLLIALGVAFPQLGLKLAIRNLLAAVNFPVALLNGFLSFLLFAGAMEVDFAELFARKWTIFALAIGGTVLIDRADCGCAICGRDSAGDQHTIRMVPRVWRVDLAD